MDVVGLVFGIFATLALLVSVGSIAWHWRIISRWKPVRAIIVGEVHKREAHLMEDTGRGRLFEKLTRNPVVGLLRAGQAHDDATHADLIQRDVRKIEYRYAYAGRWFTSSSLTLGSTRDRAEHLDRFPVGRTVTALVDPGDPGHSILLWRPWFRSYAGALFALWLLSVIVSADFEETPGPGWLTLPDSWAIHVATWWILGIGAIVHFLRLGGRFTRGAAVTAGVYFILGNSPYVAPWASTTIWAPLVAVVAPRLPEGGLETVALYVLGGLLVVGGVFTVMLIAWSVVATIVDAFRFHRSFRPVDATILLSEVRKEVRGSQSEKTPPYWYYWPEIQFEFNVAGRRYDTGAYAPTTAYGGARGGVTPTMQAIVDAHPVGSVHRARYDPRRAHIAWLVANTAGEHVRGLLAMIGWLVALPLILFYLLALWVS